MTEPHPERPRISLELAPFGGAGSSITIGDFTLPHVKSVAIYAECGQPVALTLELFALGGVSVKGTADAIRAAIYGTVTDDTEVVDVKLGERRDGCI